MSADPTAAFLTEGERGEVRAYLNKRYARILDVESHLNDYLGRVMADQQVDLVYWADLNPRRILDVGCGFGSFVLAARTRGADAIGIDVAEYEISFARRRMVRLTDGDPVDTYVLGSGYELPFEGRSFDVVTLWNVLEHVADPLRLLREVERVLVPGGSVHLVCPNYLAFRREAHYQVMWLPLLPKRLAALYLRCLRRDPSFLNSEVFYRTNWGVLRTLRKAGFRTVDPRSAKLSDPRAITRPRLRTLVRSRCGRLTVPLIRLALRCDFLNPLRPSVRVVGRKESTRQRARATTKMS